MRVQMSVCVRRVCVKETYIYCRALLQKRPIILIMKRRVQMSVCGRRMCVRLANPACEIIGLFAKYRSLLQGVRVKHARRICEAHAHASVCERRVCVRLKPITQSHTHTLSVCVRRMCVRLANPACASLTVITHTQSYTHIANPAHSFHFKPHTLIAFQASHTHFISSLTHTIANPAHSFHFKPRTHSHCKPHAHSHATCVQSPAMH